LRFDTGERVPLFAEPDANVSEGATEDQVLLVRPMVRLLPKTRYVVALRALTDTAGRAITNPAFEALKAGRVGRASRLLPLVAAYAPIFALLERAGVPRAGLTLAWDFTTGSDEQLLSHLIGMRDRAFAEWEQQKLGYTISGTSEPAGDPLLLREITGTFQVPSFLTDDGPSARLALAADGTPSYRGPQSCPFKVHIPACARTAAQPLPLLIYGHGLFNSLDEIGSGVQKQIANRLCMVYIATNWIGLSKDDVAQVASQVVPDLANFPIITDRLQQAQVNFLVLARLAVRRLKDDAAMQLAGRPVTDGSQIHYFGISQGGIEGGTFAALSPDVGRAALNVGGGEYSLMLSRSADFRPLKNLLNVTYPVQRDQQVLLAGMQSYFDFADPITFARYAIKAPLPDPATGAPMAARRLLYQEGIADAQVPNLATRLMVRELGLGLVGAPVQAVWGVAETPGPAQSGYTQWDIHAMPVPPNVDTPAAMDNRAHEGVRRIDAAQAQLGQFLRPGGMVVDTCEGAPCVFPGAGE
jgi:hypothetical protein